MVSDLTFKGRNPQKTVGGKAGRGGLLSNAELKSNLPDFSRLGLRLWNVLRFRREKLPKWCHWIESKKLVPCYLDYPLGKKTNKQTNKWTIENKQTRNLKQTNKKNHTGGWSDGQGKEGCLCWYTYYTMEVGKLRCAPGIPPPVCQVMEDHFKLTKARPPESQILQEWVWLMSSAK